MRIRSKCLQCSFQSISNKSSMASSQLILNPSNLSEIGKSVSVWGSVIHRSFWKFMTREWRRGRSVWVTDGGFWLSDHTVQLVNEEFQFLKASLTNLSKVLPEGNLQLLLQVWVFRNQHLHYNAKRLAVLAVHLSVDRTWTNEWELSFTKKDKRHIYNHCYVDLCVDRLKVMSSKRRRS